MTRHYRHRQTGTVILASLGAGLFLILVIFLLVPPANTPARLILAGVAAVMLLPLWLFGTLSAEVTDREVRAWFGPGLVRRRIALRDVREARAVRNSWWYGYGVRLVPHGWMFNAAGLDAVEIVLASGRRFRIGTDEPRELLAAIERARAAAG